MTIETGAHPPSTAGPLEAAGEIYGPWNPGIESTLPREFLPLSTVFSAANVSSSIDELEELSGFCGLPLERLTAFKPERLALHEVLIRVMADLTVPDGQKYEDLGVNFRQMTAAIMDEHIAPEMPEIHRVFERLEREATDFIAGAQHATASFDTAVAPSPGSRLTHWARTILSGRQSAARHTARPTAADRDLADIARWHAGQSVEDRFERACYQALSAAADAVFARRGRLTSDRKLITSIALRLVCNDYGSLLVGETLEPVFRNAVRHAGYRFLPAQSRPVVMNVKGASASGKSTMRPLQKQLARRLGVDWADFALISPDIWRKYLLDYDSLGRAWRYAGTLTGTELAIIDQKLDRYMSFKGKMGQLPHLLIDRFRFDSFAQDPDEEDGSRLLTRFGAYVYMFFMITPPEATVERAWTRGEQFGRYKAVDDLLAHNVEAYSGIPRLFFTWARRADKQVHFEFLDNSVAEGERPKTVAFGFDGRMNILDLACLLDVERYQLINIDARDPDAIYANASSRRAGRHSRFLKECMRNIPIIDFADYGTGQIYARMVEGKLVAWNPDVYRLAVTGPDVRAVFETVAMPPKTGAFGALGSSDRLDPGRHTTLGRWGNG
ncbi:MAG: hypothetical protein JO228_02640 [Xanthobacteraceae bacterium]|nr:hypothetical protein [Xanthobacteraceae bacterium]